MNGGQVADDKMKGGATAAIDRPCFAMYRLPHQQACHFICGCGETLSSFTPLDGRSGYVIAPFHIDADTPLVIIRAERNEVFDSPDAITEDVAEFVDGNAVVSSRCAPRDYDESREVYAKDFEAFHSKLEGGEFGKIVLSRHACAAVRKTAMEMFRTACELYPRMFIALFSSPWSGSWLVASPEIILEGSDGMWYTMALAGTMPLGDGAETRRERKAEGRDRMVEGREETVVWSEKNIREQRYVATYIADRVRPFAKDMMETGPVTTRAGQLMHLKSDFTFTTDGSNIGALLKALHPTPAVCGVPKEETCRFIIENEHCRRRYYCGFCGPLWTDGETHLFVTLRCMDLSNGLLYAGGGLLKESSEAMEWEETEAKMGTMRKVLE